MFICLLHSIPLNGNQMLIFMSRILPYTDSSIGFYVCTLSGIVSLLIWYPTTTMSHCGLVSALIPTLASTFLQVIASFLFHTLDKWEGSPGLNATTLQNSRALLQNSLNECFLIPMYVFRSFRRGNPLLFCSL